MHSSLNKSTVYSYCELYIEMWDIPVYCMFYQENLDTEIGIN